MSEQEKTVFLTVWDGYKIHRLPEDEADKLEKAGKAQVYRNGQWPGELKHRRDFPGYKTRELRAGAPDEPKPAAPAKQAANPEPDSEPEQAEKKPAKRPGKAAKK